LRALPRGAPIPKGHVSSGRARSALKSNNYGDNFVLKIFLWNFYIQRRPWRCRGLFFNTRSTYFFSAKSRNLLFKFLWKKKQLEMASIVKDNGLLSSRLTLYFSNQFLILEKKINVKKMFTTIWVLTAYF